MLVAGLSVLAVGAPVAAKEPYRPVPGGQARFVTQIDDGPVIDCLWASAEMYLDKLTSGYDVTDHERLRVLSGDLEGGSNFNHVKRAFDAIDIPFQFSPNGGDPVTWKSLLARLEAGGGAIIQGDYSKLPKRYGRWDPKFWRLDITPVKPVKPGAAARADKAVAPAKKDADDHAMYIERYDRERERVWMMDPLGFGDWKGEWISIRDLKPYVWRTAGGLLFAAVTPKSEIDVMADVTLAPASVAITSDRLAVRWPVSAAPLDWGGPVASLEPLVEPTDWLANARLSRYAKPAPVYGQNLVNGVLQFSVPPPNASARIDGLDLVADVSLPTDPGAYLVSGVLREARWDQSVASLDPVMVFVPGDRRVTWAHPENATAVSGVPFPLAVAALNSGIEPIGRSAIVTEEVLFPDTPARVVGYWLSVQGTEDPVAMDLGPIILAPGASAAMDLSIPTPPVGTWTLVLDIVDANGVSLAGSGSAPARIETTVVDLSTLVSPGHLAL